jgi:hypothetical protein
VRLRLLALLVRGCCKQFELSGTKQRPCEDGMLRDDVVILLPYIDGTMTCENLRAFGTSS